MSLDIYLTNLFLNLNILRIDEKIFIMYLLFSLLTLNKDFKIAAIKQNPIISQIILSKAIAEENA